MVIPHPVFCRGYRACEIISHIAAMLNFLANQMQDIVLMKVAMRVSTPA